MLTMKALRTLFLLAVLAALGFAFLHYFGNSITAYLFPCSVPITYTVSEVDSKFGITKKQFSDAVAKAAQFWEAPIKRDLFEPAANGVLKINSIYDYRQEATKRLEQIGIVIHDDASTYNELKAKYNAFTASYAQQKAGYETMAADYEKKKSAYESEVAYWNARGGAPKQQYYGLTVQKNALDAEAAQLNQLQARINDLVTNINALVDVMNKLAYELNLKTDQFNKIGEERGNEFEEGVYKYDALTREIDIYQFDDRAKLVRVLTHELGHALGLGHLENPKAIMYRLNQGVNEKLTADDIAALKAHCRIR